TSPSTLPPGRHREKGIRIFMWPKVIYLYPAAIVALICAIGMLAIERRVNTLNPSKPPTVTAPASPPDGADGDVMAPVTLTGRERLKTPMNLLGVLFLTVFGFNLLVMALDFPRFELVGGILGVLFVLFFALWIGVYFELDLMRPIHALFASTYAIANA